MRYQSLKGALILVAGIVAAGALAPATALADGPLALRMDVGGKCVAGHKPTGDPITVKLLWSDGTTRSTRTDNTTDFDWQVCFNVLVMGSKVKLTTSFAPVRIVRIPNLSVNADRVASVVSGRAPAGSTVDIQYAECYPGGCLGTEVRTAHVNSNGRYRREVSSSIDIDGSDYLTVRYINSHGDDFQRTTIATYMEIKARNKTFIGCQPKGTTTVKLRKSDGTLRASRTLTAATVCSGEAGSFKKDGDPVNINVGNEIRADFASDARLVWPVMSVDGTSNTVSGRCLKDARYALFIHHVSSTYPFGGTTDGNGEFSVSDSFTLEAGDILDLVCETIRGDRVRVSRTL